ncbi:MAG: D-alanyl-D-alanine carboxypeptidase/D-alanyl-D-alanine-endopeptidase [Bacteriovorax sp.]|nr:D-alanyl-D-alanine carboxypeptidase/D-alanyl-D-alanine-endopeptidase [Bacteriovorax sp.]
MKFLSIFLLLTSMSSSYADSLNNQLKAIIKKHHFNENSLGLYIEDEGKEVFNLNASKMMVPASLTKIVTGAAVLNSFPMNKKFETKLMAKNIVKDGILLGDLCLKGGGDPSFVSEKMWYLVNELKRTELTLIEGDLTVDATRFDEELFDSGRESVRVDRAFDAPISAASFNWNSTNIFIRPGAIAGSPAKVWLDPQSDYLELENNTKTVSRSGVKTLEARRVKLGDHDKIIVSGTISFDGPEAVIYKSVSNPNLWIGMHLKEFLKQRGISLKGKVKVAACVPNANTLAVSQSKNLNEITTDMLKFSNNFVAEMLAKNLAAENSTAPARMKDGIEEIKKYMDSLGFERKDYILENVSGLTRDNRFSAKQLALVLNTVKNDFLIFPEFVSGLPIAGVDGTLKNRMKTKMVDKTEQSLVRAKTGYLDGVVGLAGFAGRKNNSPLTFVFMFNGDYQQGMAARPLFDDLIKQLK